MTDDCATARQRTGSVVDKKTDKYAVTALEKQQQKELLAIIRYVQTGARRKHGKIQQKDYFIGQPLEKDEDLLVQAAIAIEGKLAGETLPGVKPDTLARLTTARQLCQGSDNSQVDKQADASLENISLADLVKRINNNRREIQLAAEGLWPHTVEANGPIRIEFQIPANKPFTASAGAD